MNGVFGELHLASCIVIFERNVCFISVWHEWMDLSPLFDAHGCYRCYSNQMMHWQSFISLNLFQLKVFFMHDTVNKNLVGVGFMSTEQKKKLLWGSKKSAAPEEVSPLFCLCWLLLSTYLLNTHTLFTDWSPVGYRHVWWSWKARKVQQTHGNSHFVFSWFFLCVLKWFCCQVG